MHRKAIRILKASLRSLKELQRLVHSLEINPRDSNTIRRVTQLLQRVTSQEDRLQLFRETRRLPPEVRRELLVRSGIPYENPDDDEEMDLVEHVREMVGLPSWEGYELSLYSETWDFTAYEAGETDDRDTLLDREDGYYTLKEVYWQIRDHSWVEGELRRDNVLSLRSDKEENYRTGEDTYYTIFIRRVDGGDLGDFPEKIAKLTRARIY